MLVFIYSLRVAEVCYSCTHQINSLFTSPVHPILCALESQHSSHPLSQHGSSTHIMLAQAWFWYPSKNSDWSRPYSTSSYTKGHGLVLWPNIIIMPPWLTVPCFHPLLLFQKCVVPFCMPLFAVFLPLTSYSHSPLWHLLLLLPFLPVKPGLASC